MLRRSLKKRVARLLLRFSATSFGERVAEYVSVLNRLLHNDSGDIELNGENWLLQRLGTQELRVVLDVGANQGDWCARALRAVPTAQVYAFEPGRRVAFSCLLGAYLSHSCPPSPFVGTGGRFLF